MAADEYLGLGRLLQINELDGLEYHLKQKLYWARMGSRE